MVIKLINWFEYLYIILRKIYFLLQPILLYNMNTSHSDLLRTSQYYLVY